MKRTMLGKRMNRKIWVVSELYYPEETSTGYFLTKIAEGLATRFPVSVLCGQPSYSERGLKAPAREHHHGVEIIRCPATTADKNKLIFKLLNLVTITLSIFFTALRHLRSNDLLFVVTNPPTLPLAMMVACRLRGASYNLIVHDVYPEVLLAAGLLKPHSWAARLIEQINRRLYRGAARVIVLGRDMKTIAARKLGHNRNALAIITNWADLEEIKPVGKTENQLLAQLGLRHKFVVQYCGNMGRTHGLEQLVEAARILRPHSDIHFLFIGQGAKRDWLVQTVRQEKLPNITVIDRRPRAALNDALNGCDLAVISFVPNMVGLSVPSRMYNILASGKPILAITDPVSELGQVVREERVGWVISPQNPEAIAAAVWDAYQKTDQLALMGQRGRAAAEQKYAFKKILSDYIGLVNAWSNKAGSDQKLDLFEHGHAARPEEAGETSSLTGSV